MIESEFEVIGSCLFNSFFQIREGVTFSLHLSFIGQSFFSLLLIFGSVLSQQSEQDSGLISIKGVSELGNDGWQFDSGEQDPFLSLEGNILGPSDESGQVSFGLNIIANPEISWLPLEQGIRFPLCFLDCSLSFSSFTLNQKHVQPLCG